MKGKLSFNLVKYNMRAYQFFSILALSFSLLGITLTSYANTKWETLAPGIQYTKLPINKKSDILHAFKINLKQNSLHLITAKQLNQASASVKKLSHYQQGLIAINGGFFSPNREPLGLRIDNGKILSQIRPISWWSVFYIKNNKPYLNRTNQYHTNHNISFAIQAGPRLVIKGKVPSLKTGIDERSAICSTRDQQVIIAATENSTISTTDLAKVLAASEENNGLNCYNALNLDGGSSTQLYARIGDFSLNVPNFNTVTDAIVVTKR